MPLADRCCPGLGPTGRPTCNQSVLASTRSTHVPLRAMLDARLRPRPAPCCCLRWAGPSLVLRQHAPAILPPTTAEPATVSVVGRLESVGQGQCGVVAAVGKTRGQTPTQIVWGAATSSQKHRQDTTKNERRSRARLFSRLCLLRHERTSRWIPKKRWSPYMPAGSVSSLVRPSTCPQSRMTESQGPNRQAHFGISTIVQATASIGEGLVLNFGATRSDKAQPPPPPSLMCRRRARRGAHMSPSIDRSETMNRLHSIDSTSVDRNWARDGAWTNPGSRPRLKRSRWRDGRRQPPN